MKAVFHCEKPPSVKSYGGSPRGSCNALPPGGSAKEPRGSFAPGDRVEDEPGTVPYAAERDERIFGCLPPVNFLKFEEIAVRRRPQGWMSAISPVAVEDAGGSQEEQGLSRAKFFSQ